MEKVKKMLTKSNQNMAVGIAFILNNMLWTILMLFVNPLVGISVVVAGTIIGIVIIENNKV